MVTMLADDDRGTRACSERRWPTTPGTGRPPHHRPARAAARSASWGFCRWSVVTEREAIDFILDSVAAGQPGWVITPNLDTVAPVSRTAGAARDVSRRRTVVIADGMPLNLGQPHPGDAAAGARAGVGDHLHLEPRGGGARGVGFTSSAGTPAAGRSAVAAAKLLEQSPTLKVAGRHYCPAVRVREGRARDGPTSSRGVRRPKPRHSSTSGSASPSRKSLIERLRPALPARPGSSAIRGQLQASSPARGAPGAAVGAEDRAGMGPPHGAGNPAGW